LRGINKGRTVPLPNILGAVARSEKHHTITYTKAHVLLRGRIGIFKSILERAVTEQANGVYFGHRRDTVDIVKSGVRNAIRYNATGIILIDDPECLPQKLGITGNGQNRPLHARPDGIIYITGGDIGVFTNQKVHQAKISRQTPGNRRRVRRRRRVGSQLIFESRGAGKSRPGFDLVAHLDGVALAYAGRIARVGIDLLQVYVTLRHLRGRRQGRHKPDH
jgi:hypothetical protein